MLDGKGGKYVLDDASIPEEICGADRLVCDVAASTAGDENLRTGRRGAVQEDNAPAAFKFARKDCGGEAGCPGPHNDEIGRLHGL